MMIVASQTMMLLSALSSSVPCDDGPSGGLKVVDGPCSVDDVDGRSLLLASSRKVSNREPTDIAVGCKEDKSKYYIFNLIFNQLPAPITLTQRPHISTDWWVFCPEGPLFS